jgi:organic radical activating enzyme
MDDINTNKQFRLYDSNAKFIRLSVDEVIAREHNKWQNWECSAGVRGLYIDYDGNIWMCNTSSANQSDNFNYPNWLAFSKEHKEKYDEKEWEKTKVIYLKEFRQREDAYNNVMLHNNSATKKNKIGFLGNIKEGFEIRDNWSQCPWEKCSCGADVILSKAKSSFHREILAVTNKSWEGKEFTKDNTTDNIVDFVAAEMNFPIPYQILWDLGRLCNYDCSYCWPNVHNRHEKHKDYNDIVNVCDNIINNWSKGDTIRWNFGGGEPTLHPNFLDLLKFLKSKNQWIMVTSNGTRDYKYWSQAVKYLNSINLSAHFEGLKDEKDEDRFIKNIQVICDHFASHDDDHWLEIKIMTTPEFINRALALKEKIKKLEILHKKGANNRINGVVSLVPIRKIGNSGQLVEYTEEQLEILRNQ